jgi:hypothetical protein
MTSFRQIEANRRNQEIIDGMYQDAVAAEDNMENADEGTGSQPTLEFTDRSDDLTRSFVRLTNLPTYPLDRLSRYEATLWRQACQILFTLRCLDRRKPWERLRLR